MVQYKIVIFGDVTKDGAINTEDLATLKQYLLKRIHFTPEVLMAGDVSNDEKVTIKDLIAVKKHLLGISLINPER